ncbi:MAG TPA: 5-(carboxyamino)imidazole ribonucleotide synthase [Thermoanaerobaculia bacterium]|nr:5-(carboxyamino)imidazole ribonucleotide synthase [Thermoanaerobaculia bacterium]
MNRPIVPGAAIGVLGGGQLGRMFAIAARRMGYRVHTLSPERETPAGQVSDVEVTAPYEDLDAVSRFARGVSVVTFEFENVPAATADAAARFCPVRPAGSVLHVAQQRVREKETLSRMGLPVTPFCPIREPADLEAAAARVGLPAVLKSASFGYDGKGQSRVESAAALERTWREMGSGEAILEKLIDFRSELSVVAARGVGGEFRHYGAIENRHEAHILDVSVAPADLPGETVREATEIARAVLEGLDVIGVLCVEMFLTSDGRLLINEIAPRPHNSGHLTFDASVTSQFEQQLRAVCGLPLGDTELLRPAAMVNLLGDLWAGGEPDWTAAAAFPAVKVHLYGKDEPRPRRKMGHLTALASSPAQARQMALEARRALVPDPARVRRGKLLDGAPPRDAAV